ncbi:glycoside hydrolase family 9 protein [Mucilaginibacter sp. Bleaf8]|uniref:glycoside hydrolase family 9 protein n=1 Tax=Mucilaginibacter sp. Bleaf8 TaxID=2834430 RepID=UPI001BD052A0|nr:glycoside hydrolase family 9 protein [Mucilaginibacter sp. Bleaf8]MBS7566644.1 glycoside hydrolase family 9 protein [Mucilaginibacter sp. Bleaf8]
MVTANIIKRLISGLGLLAAASSMSCAQTPPGAGADSIRLNQMGFYPHASKVAIVLTNKAQQFTIETADHKKVFTGQLRPSAKPDLSGKAVYVANFTALQQPGKYVLQVPGIGYSYTFEVRNCIHQPVATASIKAFYYQRASIALPEKYAGQWHRPAGHPDNQVLVHPSAASATRPAGTFISSSRGWYDAGDYNKYIVNSGISMATLLSVCEDFPDYISTVKLNIPESSNKVPDMLDEILWNLRWMLTMQDPADGGVYHKLTNARFDGMVMPDDAKEPRYVVQKSTAATLDFTAVMAQASRVMKRYKRELPGLGDSCRKAALKAWQWAQANPKVIYDQTAMNAAFKPEVVTGTYGDQQVADEFDWAAAEMYITMQDDRYLNKVPLGDKIKLSIPNWGQVRMLGYYSLLRNRNRLTLAGKAAMSTLTKQMLAFADSLTNPATLPAYQTVMGRSARNYGWGSSSEAANQGVALVQAYLFTNKPQYLNAALSNLDYLLGRNGTGYCFITGLGSKPVMHPHHRPSVADGIVPPVPGLLSGGPNPGRQDGIALPSLVPNQAFVDDDRAYAVNEIAINWNAPLVYLANAMEALQYRSKYAVPKKR